MKKISKFLIALFFGLIIFYLVLRRSGPETLVETFFLFFSLEGLVIVSLTVLTMLVSIWRWRVILNCQGEEVDIFPLAGIWSVGFSVDYLTPGSLFGGEALRVYLTGKILDIDWEKSFSSVIIDKILDGTFHIIFIVVGIIAFLHFGEFPEIWIFRFIVLFLVLTVSGLAFFYFRAIGKKSIVLFVLSLFGLKKTRIKSTKNGEFIFNTEANVLRFFSPGKSFFWKGAALSFLRHGLIYVRAFLLIFFLVGNFNFLGSLAVQGLAYLAMLLPLPAGLGGLEAISAFGFRSLEFGFEKGTVFGITWRSADLVICLFGLIMAIKLGLKLFELKTFGLLDTIIKSSFINNINDKKNEA